MSVVAWMSEPHEPRRPGVGGALQRSSDGRDSTAGPVFAHLRNCATFMTHFPLSDWPLAERARIHGVLTDIDDTLTTDGAITPDALAALHALRAAGLPVFAITGRPRAGASPSHWPGRWTPSWPRTARWRSGAAPTVRCRRLPAGRGHPQRQLRPPAGGGAARAGRTAARPPVAGQPRARDRHRHRPQRVRPPGRGRHPARGGADARRRAERHRQLHPHQRLDRRAPQAGRRSLDRARAAGPRPRRGARPLGLCRRLDQRRAHVRPLPAQRGRGQRGALLGPAGAAATLRDARESAAPVLPRSRRPCWPPARPEPAHDRPAAPASRRVVQ